MKRRVFLKTGMTAMTTMALANTLGAAPAREATALKAGFARMDVSTKTGPVHDPVYLKALVLDDGVTRAALVSIDTICLGGGIGEIPDSFFPGLKRRSRKIGINFLHRGMVCKTGAEMFRFLPISLGFQE